MQITRDSSLRPLIEWLEQPGRTAFCLALLIVVSFAQYSNIIGNGFVWDSIPAFVEDTSIRDFSSIPEYFSRGYSITEDTEGGITYLKYYRPLVKLFHLLEYKLIGQEPIGYKLVSILLGAITAVLSFFCIRSVSNSTAVALVASLLYVVNPIRPEVISLSYSDSYLLMSIFSLLAFITYQKERYVLSILMFCCALLSWEGAALFPAILVAYEWLIRKSASVRQYFRALPFFSLLGGYLLVRHLVVGPLPVTEVPLLAFINTVLVIIKKSVKMAFIPDGPVTLYKFHLYQSITREVVISYIAAAGLAVFAAFLWKKDRVSLFWFSWFLIWIAISFNIGKLAEYLTCQNFQVLAVLGPCALVARTIRLKGWPSLVAGITIVCLLIFHFTYTYSRNRYYKDTITYLEEAIKFQPDFQIVLYSLGTAYAEAGEHEKALIKFRTLIALDPSTASVVNISIGTTFRKRAHFFTESGNHAEALQAYKDSFDYRPADSLAHNNMGNILFKMGRASEAVASWRKALEMDSDDPGPHFNIGSAMESSGDHAGALRSYESFVSAVPAEKGSPLRQEALKRIKRLREKGN